MSAHVTSPEQLREALADNVSDITLGCLYFEKPEQSVNVSEVRLAAKHGNALTLRGAGGHFGETQLVRLCDGPPLLTFAEDRHWEFRWSGLMFHNHKGKYAGKAFDVAYCQQSRFVDIRLEEWNDEPFTISANGSTFDFLQLYYNRKPARITQGAVLTLRDTVTNAEWGTDRNAGLEITAGPHNPPYTMAEVLRITQPHNEGCTTTVRGFNRGVLYEGGHHLAATVSFEECGRVDVDSRGMSWESSTMTVNGKARNPMRTGIVQRIFGS